ncbi:MAG: hypothetical protein O2955_17100 [Planctomycetota bacterium]|nr:hypothetical protein [Planctomycetota bacterium]MDA1214231.1 hypothetical protein [Planctomycetota bacterium]
MQTTSFEPQGGFNQVMSRTFHDLPVGKVVKLRWPTKPGDNRKWIEISAEKFEEKVPPPVIPQKRGRPFKGFLG